MISLVLFASLFVLLLISVPIGICLGLATMLVMVLVDGTPPMVLLARSVVTGADSFPLIAVPLFILAGDLMQHGGMSRRLVGFANSLIGHIRAGLAYVNVLACVFFAAISGSSPATVAAIGSNLIPEMEKVGYTRRFSSALTASSGMIGVMIPPSIPFIIYGVTAEVSIGKLFLAGVVPGILFAIMFMVIARLLLRKDRDIAESTTSFSKEAVKTSFRESIWALLVPVIILGGIYSGVFTPTEAGAIAVVYALLVGLFVYGDLTFSDLPKVFADSARTSGSILVLVIMATAFGRLITIARIPSDIALSLTSLSDNPIVILLLINLLLLVIGMFMETISSIIIMTPILLPVATAVGVDPIAFGVIITVNLAIGFCTPPLGVNLFVASSISGVSIEKLSKSILPFFVGMLILLFLITYVPAISLTLPALW
ncbi:TRAP transporter large permease [Shimia thalassica]|uniref:TRAP transporter large permease n=1 Tax=Shimia thalassica TaxID=1715693 RepID=UPI0024949B1B|nr:TRAP transporter large permease [Shimia thalassica]MDO6481335.1 TRAP transporter large permease [Shimia thalassica]MDO6523170.1 TRAP transporter large permease [Shimia thalassica]MDO6800321.1 TRAP transporter large permease [Shimia thalassica]MDP2495956.1 TRAP transporter large permease [Shimia thalassica]MDP2580569.1 TRAP transporter large permease [Shimia thalassica]